ncbi:uncharacterized protein EAF01_010118 [Botrytis porri]|uniref:uncharacterized protein n=1 Tax=Botrytis porri TaxID=87229 RepID=UPI0019029AD5|nr:uncharacterized protein EAF01_010118 [Botrytis porri]KAF7894668.1 hypothetical protein EAF01_010118 [Botrytis porri]
MVHRFNRVPSRPDRSTLAELAEMLNELCWAIDQRNPLLLNGENNESKTNFKSLANLCLPDGDVSLFHWNTDTTVFFQIKVTPNLDPVRDRRAREALQHLHTAFYVGQQGGSHVPYRVVEDRDAHYTQLASGFAGNNVQAIRQAFRARNLYCEARDSQHNLYQGLFLKDLSQENKI